MRRRGGYFVTIPPIDLQSKRLYTLSSQLFTIKEGEDCMKRFLIMFLLCVLPLGALGETAPYTLEQYAVDCLTEVFGYSEEETKDFHFEYQPDGRLFFWPDGHPDWVYTVFYDANGRLDGTTPFYPDYRYYCGENAVRGILSEARAKGWFQHWNAQAKQEMDAACLKENVSCATELPMAETADQAIQAFFESCYGPDWHWPEAIASFRDAVLMEYNLTLNPAPFRMPGVRRGKFHGWFESITCDLTLFDQSIPEELADAFADEHLSGWTLSCGAEAYVENRVEKGPAVRYALAAFEKDGRRQLVMLWDRDGNWNLVPLGENALYPTGEYRIGYSAKHLEFTIEYLLGQEETAVFYLSPVATIGANGLQTDCLIESYERVNRNTGEVFFLNTEKMGFQTTNEFQSIPRRFRHLGTYPMTEFPTTAEAYEKSWGASLPDGYVASSGVNLRVKTSSQSESRGIVKAGAILPVLERLPGKPDAWIHTKIGFLEGYVSSAYTEESDRSSSLPIAVASQEIALKKGTGIFDGAVASFPAGTKMHIIIDNGDWLYVDVPRGEIGFSMDVGGTFGYVRKDEINQMELNISNLTWPE